MIALNRIAFLLDTKIIDHIVLLAGAGWFAPSGHMPYSLNFQNEMTGILGLLGLNHGLIDFCGFNSVF